MGTTLLMLGVVEILLAQNTLEELQEKAIQGLCFYSGATSRNIRGRSYP